VSEKGGELGSEQVSDKSIHELNKEQKALSELPIKVIPPDQERRLHWLAKKAIIFYVPQRRSGYAPEYEPEYSWRAVKFALNFIVEETIKWVKERMDLDFIKELPLDHGTCLCTCYLYLNEKKESFFSYYLSFSTQS